MSRLFWGNTGEVNGTNVLYDDVSWVLRLASRWLEVSVCTKRVLVYFGRLIFVHHPDALFAWSRSSSFSDHISELFLSAVPRLQLTYLLCHLLQWNRGFIPKQAGVGSASWVAGELLRPSLPSCPWRSVGSYFHEHVEPCHVAYVGRHCSPG